ncbi:MAG: flagellar basal body-associated FliL family protein [Ectothiorhodospiraceae bacterium]|nr:flagellar basal body-associated FliL family protein [Ectothiorhodospiraceae bacterium]
MRAFIGRIPGAGYRQQFCDAQYIFKTETPWYHTHLEPIYGLEAVQPQRPSDSIEAKMPKFLLPLLTALSATIFSPLHAASDKTPPSPYLALNPPVTVNLANRRRATFLQVEIEFGIEDAKDRDIVTKHSGPIRDRLILYFSGRDPAEIQSAERREEMRAEVLEEIRQALTELSGRPAVQELFFTHFVTQ